ncbi:hypothetical protein GWK47_035560 [Chionoecetes opilio]|uniref:Uncharacterized protein n=1 Tax=Chionoecetes opilio TaxID=41210 RepID=A0A8J4YTX1_CHIOP|nr:hypothetical protein GWK47_035560 [Chionoecetes opilio]
MSGVDCRVEMRGGRRRGNCSPVLGGDGNTRILTWRVEEASRGRCVVSSDQHTTARGRAGSTRGQPSGGGCDCQPIIACASDFELRPSVLMSPGVDMSSEMRGCWRRWQHRITYLYRDLRQESESRRLCCEQGTTSISDSTRPPTLGGGCDCQPIIAGATTLNWHQRVRRRRRAWQYMLAPNTRAFFFSEPTPSVGQNPWTLAARAGVGRGELPRRP